MQETHRIKNNIELPWHIVEKAILKEKTWLAETFDFTELQKSDCNENQYTSKLSIDEMLRQISISIIRGNILAKELKSKQINGLWVDDSSDWEKESIGERHGEEWHRAMMAIIKKHFRENGFEVIDEPFLNQGRADLGVYCENFPNLFIEVGSTSLFKTWINLHTMPDCVFLFVPSVYYALEFQTK